MAGEPEGAGLTWLSADRLDAAVARWQAQHPAGRVVELAGKRAGDRAGLFDEVAAALSLPSWFGRNWDALADALTDLSWLDGSAYLLVVRDADWLLHDHPGQRETLLTVLDEAAARWDRDPGPGTFATVLVTGTAT